MHIVYHDRFNKVIKTDITSLVAYDDSGNPVLVCVKLIDNSAIVSHALDADFKKVLADLGVDRTATVNLLRTNSLQLS